VNAQLSRTTEAQLRCGEAVAWVATPVADAISAWLKSGQQGLTSDGLSLDRKQAPARRAAGFAGARVAARPPKDVGRLPVDVPHRDEPDLIWGAAALTDFLNEINATPICTSRVYRLANGYLPCAVKSERSPTRKGPYGPTSPGSPAADRWSSRRPGLAQRGVTSRTGNPGGNSRNETHTAPPASSERGRTHCSPEADEVRRFQECAVILKPKSPLWRPTSGTGTGSTCRNGCLGLVDRRDHRP
jgi:hypothetical protein